MGYYRALCSRWAKGASRIAQQWSPVYQWSALAGAKAGARFDVGVSTAIRWVRRWRETGSAWISALIEAGVKVSMDGRGRYLDNIFIERLWRSLKYEAVYLQDIADGFEAGHVIDDWMHFYNRQRPHSALGAATPDEAYGDQPELRKAA